MGAIHRQISLGRLGILGAAHPVLEPTGSVLPIDNDAARPGPSGVKASPSGRILFRDDNCTVLGHPRADRPGSHQALSLVNQSPEMQNHQPGY